MCIRDRDDGINIIKGNVIDNRYNLEKTASLIFLLSVVSAVLSGVEIFGIPIKFIIPSFTIITFARALGLSLIHI